MAKKNQKSEFSKKLLTQESLLIWIVTIAFIILAFVCIQNQYFGELPWLTAMAACPWGAYAVGQGFYYKKAEKENVIKLSQMTQDDNPPIPEEQFEEDAQG